ncbi:MAG: phosphoenolpyruvate--protein phosphotransferase [Desulfurococcus sp.]|nr:phosphoenolpyruvate--protein phosphotransferase [Desulfurococcus sp.]
MERRLKGIPVSWGVGYGRPVSLTVSLGEGVDYKGVEAERALLEAKSKLLAELDELKKDAPRDVAEILEAHKLMVEALVDEAVGEVRGGRSALEALAVVFEKYKELLESSGAALTQLKVEDLIEIRDSLAGLLRGAGGVNIGEGSVLVAVEVYPSQLLRLARRGLKAVIAEKGSYTSHAAIIARSLGVPAVFGVRDAVRSLSTASLVVVDGFTGLVIADPGEDTLRKLMARKQAFDELSKKFMEVKGKLASTRDGRRITVAANIGGEDDLNTALMNGAEGVGLFRVEFYYLGASSPPPVEKLAEVFARMAEKLEGKPLVIRLLDVGGDKPLPYMPAPRESNPFLGLRGIRLLFKYRGVLEDQLKAVFKAASRHSNIKVMAPMVSTLEEVRELKKIIEEASRELNVRVDFGIMVEVPSVVYMADKIAREVDFLSIGTNDLTQYIFAADRVNENVSYLYDDMHPAVLRAIEVVSREAHRAGIPVHVCGELAGNPLAIPILVGLGVDELSVSPALIPLVKWVVNGIEYTSSVKLAEEALKLDNGGEVREKARGFLSRELGVEIPW